MGLLACSIGVQLLQNIKPGHLNCYCLFLQENCSKGKLDNFSHSLGENFNIIIVFHSYSLWTITAGFEVVMWSICRIVDHTFLLPSCRPSKIENSLSGSYPFSPNSSELLSVWCLRKLHKDLLSYILSLTKESWNRLFSHSDKESGLNDISHRFHNLWIFMIVSEALFHLNWTFRVKMYQKYCSRQIIFER